MNQHGISPCTVVVDSPRQSSRNGCELSMDEP